MADTRTRIINLPEATVLDASMNFIEDSADGYGTRRVTYDTLKGAINKEGAANLAPAYSNAATYNVGDLCTYQGTLYSCSTQISTAEDWTAAHWTATNMAADVSQLKSTLSEYESIFTGDVDESVQNWLDSHPEATTTVQNGTITEAKLADSLKLKTINGYITPEMYGAKGDGVTDDQNAFESAINAMSAGDVLYLENSYLVSDTINVTKEINIIGYGRIIVSHSKPAIVVDGVESASIDICGIEKSARVFDYVEGGIGYSIGVVVKNCTGCKINVKNIINLTTAFVLIATDNNGCQYNQISCDNAMTFTGIEIIRSSTGGWVNGNTISKFRWMVNTWFDNTELVAAYMIKSLSYAKSNETDPYMNNANKFDGLIAEYGAQAADYPILLVRLDYARGYTFSFDRVEILAKNSSLSDNSFYFTNSVFCIANVWFNLSSYTSSIGDLGTDHNAIYIKENYEKLKQNEVVDILSVITLHESLSYTDYWFYAVKNPLTKSVKIVGELIVSADIANNTVVISNVPKCRLGFGTMKIQIGTTATLWQAPTNVSHYKLNIGGNATEIRNTGTILSGTRLYVDFEYLAADSEFN